MSADTRPAATPPAAAAGRKELLESLVGNFDALDRDGDGVLRYADLAAAAKAPTPPAMQRAATLALESRDPVVVDLLRTGATPQALWHALSALSVQFAIQHSQQHDRLAEDIRQKQAAHVERSQVRQREDRIDAEFNLRREVDNKLAADQAQQRASARRAALR